MLLHSLPTRTAGAAENMALDFMLLQRYPERAALRFRHYDWRAPAVTYGYSQKIAVVREQLGSQEKLDLCRRVTGGGIVDHREDWTYAVVLPRGHPAEELRAAQSYRLVHEALAAALIEQGVPVRLKPGGDDVAAGDPGAGSRLQEKAGAGVCFQRAETFDVIHEGTGAKVAGAAQKRNKHGLLLQGSVARRAAGGDALDWDRFHRDFVAALGVALVATVQPTPWPEFNDEEVEALTEQYSSQEWIEYR